MSEYGTVGGVPVGDEDIEAMVANAEALSAYLAA